MAVRLCVPKDNDAMVQRAIPVVVLQSTEHPATALLLSMKVTVPFRETGCPMGVTVAVSVTA
jgi:hypothetical protein